MARTGPAEDEQYAGKGRAGPAEPHPFRRLVRRERGGEAGGDHDGVKHNGGQDVGRMARVLVQTRQDDAREQDRRGRRPVGIAREIDRLPVRPVDGAGTQLHGEVGGGGDEGDDGVELRVVAEFLPLVSVQVDRERSQNHDDEADEGGKLLCAHERSRYGCAPQRACK